MITYGSYLYISVSLFSEHLSNAIPNPSHIITARQWMHHCHCHPERHADRKKWSRCNTHDELLSRVERSIFSCSVGACIMAALSPFLFLRTFSMKASPALYEDLTRGPLAQYRNPKSRARTRHCSNTSGVTYSSTFMCRFVGRMYWPNVTTSTSTLRSSEKRLVIDSSKKC